MNHYSRIRTDEDDAPSASQKGSGVVNVAIVVIKESEGEYNVNAQDDGREALVVAGYSAAHDKALQELFASPDMSLEPMKRYSTVGETGAVHFIPDARSRVYVVVTREGYPSRVAHMLLEELQDNFLLSSEGPASLTAKKPHALSDALSELFDDLIKKFADPSTVDKLAALHEKVEVTTNVMHENVSLLLENDETLEVIQSKTDELSETAGRFESGSIEFKNKMWWKKCKMQAFYIVIVCIILACVVTPIAIWIDSASKRIEVRNNE